MPYVCHVAGNLHNPYAEKGEGLQDKAIKMEGGFMCHT